MLFIYIYINSKEMHVGLNKIIDIKIEGWWSLQRV